MRERQSRSLSRLLTVLLATLLATAVNTTHAQTTIGESELPSFRPAGFIQQQFVADQTDDIPTRFAIHRARIGLTGNVTEQISVNFVGGYNEPPNNNPALVNAFIDFDIHPMFQLRTGQFLVPFGLEGPEVIIFNPAIERSTSIQRLNTFTMFRDVGVQASGNGGGFTYAIALINGRGANPTQQIAPKDLTGKVGLNLTDDVSIGLSGHLGHYRPSPALDNESRHRIGVDIAITQDPMFLRGEYIIRRDDLPGGDRLNMNGGYLLTGVQLTENLEGIVRIDYFEPNNSVDDNEYTGVTFGANYYFIGNTRLSVNYELRNDQMNPNLGNLLTVQMQLAL